MAAHQDVFSAVDSRSNIAPTHHVPTQDQADFDSGSFTFITEDDLVQQQHQHQSYRSAVSAPSLGGRRLSFHDSSGQRLDVRVGRAQGRRASGATNKHSEKVKTKLISVWNNVRYGWMVKSKATFGRDLPIVLLGKCYYNRRSRDSTSSSESSDADNVDGCEEAKDGGDYSSDHDMRAFYRDFESRIWLTYRRDFPCLENSTLTTDCGWGCMLRCGQMALAQALVVHLLGRDWRPERSRGCSSQASVSKDSAAAFDNVRHRQQLQYHHIVSCFADSPSALTPFSVHRLVQYGTAVIGKKAGDWYGPASTALILQEAVNHYASSSMQPAFGNLCVYVARDCTIYKQDVIKLCTQQRRANIAVIADSGMGQLSSWRRPSHNATAVPDTGLWPAPRRPLHGTPERVMQQATLPPGGGCGSYDMLLDAPSTGKTAYSTAVGSWKSVIILVPVRLGGERLNDLYIPCLQGLLAHEHCLGIMGGRPQHSLYFVGYQGDKLLYLDPHFCQDCVDTSAAPRPFDTESFHCKLPRKLAFSDMDPSCTIGFYCRDQLEFESFLKSIEPYLIIPGLKTRYPMFIIDQGSEVDCHMSAKLSAAPLSQSAH